ncbi:MAG: ROK family protein, partial [Candidatus Omnitrophica bacterium]|nr:ROK family protein [Candidatus Omnitrophota bacterium]
VPIHALTFSLTPILNARHIHIIVPRAFKAEAVRQTLDEPISENIPASGLRLPEVLPRVKFYFDPLSAAQSSVRETVYTALVVSVFAIVATPLSIFGLFSLIIPLILGFTSGIFFIHAIQGRKSLEELTSQQLRAPPIWKDSREIAHYTTFSNWLKDVKEAILNRQFNKLFALITHEIWHSISRSNLLVYGMQVISIAGIFMLLFDWAAYALVGVIILEFSQFVPTRCTLLSNKPIELLHTTPLPEALKVAVVEIRPQEANLFAGLLINTLQEKASDIHYFFFCQDADILSVRNQLVKFDPDIVILPQHEDGSLLNTQVRNIISEAIGVNKKERLFYGYETPQRIFNYNLFCPLTRQQWPRVMQAMAVHVSQMQRVAYDLAVDAQARANAIMLRNLIEPSLPEEFEYVLLYQLRQIRQGRRENFSQPERRFIYLPYDVGSLKSFWPVNSTIIGDAPHPDDTEIGLGALFVLSSGINSIFSRVMTIGYRVMIAGVADDAIAQKTAIRVKESEHGAEVLGIDTQFLNHPQSPGGVGLYFYTYRMNKEMPKEDREVYSNQERVIVEDELQRLYREHLLAKRSQLILCNPEASDKHPDHQISLAYWQEAVCRLSRQEGISISLIEYVSPWAGEFNAYIYADKPSVCGEDLMIKAANLILEANAHPGGELILTGGFAGRPPLLASYAQRFFVEKWQGIKKVTSPSTIRETAWAAVVASLAGLVTAGFSGLFSLSLLVTGGMLFLHAFLAHKALNELTVQETRVPPSIFSDSREIAHYTTFRDWFKDVKETLLNRQFNKLFALLTHEPFHAISRSNIFAYMMQAVAAVPLMIALVIGIAFYFIVSICRRGSSTSDLPPQLCFRIENLEIGTQKIKDPHTGEETNLESFISGKGFMNAYEKKAKKLGYLSMLPKVDGKVETKAIMQRAKAAWQKATPLRDQEDEICLEIVLKSIESLASVVVAKIGENKKHLVQGTAKIVLIGSAALGEGDFFNLILNRKVQEVAQRKKVSLKEIVLVLSEMQDERAIIGAVGNAISTYGLFATEYQGKYFIGVDLGGTHIRAASVNPQNMQITGEIVSCDTFPITTTIQDKSCRIQMASLAKKLEDNFNATGLDILHLPQGLINRLLNEEERGIHQELTEMLFREISELVSRLRNKDTVGIALASPGIFGKDGYVYLAYNVPFTSVNIIEELQRRHGIPTYVGNDVACGGIGELLAGAGRGRQNLFCLNVGTGVNMC